MIRNYITIAFRNLSRQKGYSFINIFGLTLGLCCFLLIALYVSDELRYDRFHTHADRVYRVTREIHFEDGKHLHLALISAPFGPRLKNDFPQVAHAARMMKAGTKLAYKETSNEENFYFAEKEIFNIFTFNILAGNLDNALARPMSIMLSRPMAQKYFKGEDPMGKIMHFGKKGEFQLEVTGIFEPLPAQSHFHTDFLVSLATVEDERIFGKENLHSNFGGNGTATYLLLQPNADAAALEKAFPQFLDKHVGKDAHKTNQLHLQKLTDIHLTSHTDAELEANGDIKYIYLFSAIALFILLIACINYMNLSTARAARRAKEVGLRKVVGAERRQLILQFISESIVLTAIALVLAVGAAIGLLPFLNEFSGKLFTIHHFFNPYLIAALAGLTLFTGVIAGSYPAFYLASFQPVEVLKGKLSTISRNSILRQSLVVFQYSVSILLILCTLIVFGQLRFMQNKNLGFNKEQVIILPAPQKDNIELVKQALESNPHITHTALSSHVPSWRLMDFRDVEAVKPGAAQPVKYNIKVLSIDHDFIPAYQIKMLAGRNFSKDFPADDSTAVILNEAAIREIGWKSAAEAIGQPFVNGKNKCRIVGVLADVHFESLHQKIEPLLFELNSHRLGNLSVRVDGKNISAAIAHLEQTWQKFQPEETFTYQFLDEKFNELYKTELTRGKLFTVFTCVSVFIACLGLFALASFIITQRTKEIGIRKVLGASLQSIIGLVIKEFLILLAIAFIIAAPIGYYVMYTWLQDFAYRINIKIEVFLFAGVITFGIAICTISYQAIKAALANPVKSLRSE